MLGLLSPFLSETSEGLIRDDVSSRLDAKPVLLQVHHKLIEFVCISLGSTSRQRFQGMRQDK